MRYACQKPLKENNTAAIDNPLRSSAMHVKARHPPLAMNPRYHGEEQSQPSDEEQCWSDEGSHRLYLSAIRVIVRTMATARR